jgi:hypothetical protein
MHSEWQWNRGGCRSPIAHRASENR